MCIGMCLKLKRSSANGHTTRVLLHMMITKVYKIYNNDEHSTRDAPTR